MKKIKIAIVLLILVLLTACEQSNNKANNLIKNKITGKYQISYNYEGNYFEGIEFYKKIELKECDNKKSTGCLKENGNDEQFAVMINDDQTYISIPVKYLVNKEKSKIDGLEDEYESRICFEKDEYDKFLYQIMCPPADDMKFNRDPLDPEYYFKLDKVEEK